MSTRRPVRLAVKALAVIAWAVAGLALASRAGAQAMDDAMIAGPAMPAAPRAPGATASAASRESVEEPTGAPATPHHEGPKPRAVPVSTAAVNESIPLGPAGFGAPASTPDQPAAPPLVPAASELGPMLTTLAGVVALIVIVVGGIGLARRGRGHALAHHRAPSGILEVLGRYPMPGGVMLILMRAGARVLLLSQARASRLGGARLETLAEFEDADEVASILALARDARDESISARFGTLLSAFAAEHPAGGRAAAHTTDNAGNDESGVDVIERGADPDHIHADPYAPREHGSSLLRRRLEGLRAWEGVTA